MKSLLLSAAILCLGMASAQDGRRLPNSLLGLRKSRDDLQVVPWAKPRGQHRLQSPYLRHNRHRPTFWTGGKDPWISKHSQEGRSSNATTSIPEAQMEAPGRDANSTLDRDGRFLSLFTVVKFENGGCLSASGDNGTCYTAKECAWRGGSSSGHCAGGYGVCCVCTYTSLRGQVETCAGGGAVTHTCGDVTDQNCTYFVNGGYPSSYDGTGSCQLTVHKCSPDVCQLRLDFDSFSIAQPTAAGICQNDQFIVGGGSSVPTICGVNTGNQMYVDVGNTVSSPVTLTLVTSGNSYGRSWKVKITQIKCKGLSRAPDGCLQYHTGVSGQIRSFNFDLATGQQLANQDYTTCIRMEQNFCSIRYTACQDPSVMPGSPNQRSRSFSITGTQAANVGALVGPVSCQTDWVNIPCATNTGGFRQAGNTSCSDRICGDTFNSEASTQAAPVFSGVKPFRVYYHTNSDENNDSGNRGFCLDYVQQPCSLPSYGGVKPFRVTYHTNENEVDDEGNRGFCLLYVQQPCTSGSVG